MEGEYRIELKADAMPFTLSTLQWVPQPLKGQEKTYPHGRTWSNIQSEATHRLVYVDGRCTETR